MYMLVMELLQGALPRLRNVRYQYLRIAARPMEDDSMLQVIEMVSVWTSCADLRVRRLTTILHSILPWKIIG